VVLGYGVNRHTPGFGVAKKKKKKTKDRKMHGSDFNVDNL
jgi:hypothetical protein